MDYVVEFTEEFWAICIAMAPYLLLGFLFAGVLKVWFPQSWIDRYMGKNNFMSVFNTALLGIPLPLCSCGVIPTGISFYRNGASKGSSVSFFISTPQTGIDSVLVTYSLLGLPFAILRVIIALVTGVAGGIITNLTDKEHLDKDFVNQKNQVQKVKTTKLKPIFRIFQYGFYEFLMDIAKWLIIGLLLAALLSVIIPENFFTLYLDNELLSMLIVLVASVPLYLCATASVPVAAILMLKGLSPGAALVLLMAGPATNAATITIIKKVFGNKTLLSYLASIIIGALFFGFLINNFLPREWFSFSELGAHMHHEHELIPGLFQITSAITLIVLIINGYIIRWYKNRKQNRITSTLSSQQSVMFTDTNPAPAVTLNTTSFSFTANATKPSKTLHVEGMTCNHCKASVENNLSKIKGITNVNANPQLNTVVLYGDKYDLNEAIKMIEQLGYNYKAND